jgi:cobalt-zinc-cadmium resistance protein CzcA
MLDRILHFSIHNKIIIGLFTLALLLWGSWSLTKLPIDAVPDITNNQVQVITYSPTLAAPDVERLITFPIELRLASIPGQTEIRSISRFGLSVITIVFTEETDVYWARQQVNERIQQAQQDIPAGIGVPELAPVSTGLSEIYQYIIRPKKGYEEKYNPTDLRTIQDWIVRRQLLGVKGVADVSSFGGYVKQYEIAIQPDRLRSMGVTVADVFNAVEKNNQNTGGAYIDKQPNVWMIRTEGLANSLEAIGSMVVKQNDIGNPILVSDVSEVHYGHAIRYGAMTYNQEGEVVGAIVLMLKGENSAEVIKTVKARMETIQKTLPEGVVVDVFLDRSKLVDKAIHTVSKNLLEGALIVIFVLVVLLGNFRAGLIVASVIPLSMLFAVSMMNLFGVSGNLMSLGAIDFGLIVDGAVIIVEATLHFLHRYSGQRLTAKQMDEAVYESAVNIRKTAAFGEIIILIVYLPILALVGVEGKMFKPMAQTVSFAILGAFILSLTYVPMMSSLFLSKHITDHETFSDKLVNRVRASYKPILTHALEHRKIWLGTVLALFVGSTWLFMHLGGEFIPSLDEGDFAVEVRLLPGSSMSQTIEVTDKAAGLLKKNFPEVKEVVGKIGTAEIPTDPMPMEACDLMIILKDRDEWTTTNDKIDLANRMQAVLEANIPGCLFSFQQPIQMRFNELMTGAKQDVAIKLYGDNLDELARIGHQITGIIAPVAGVKDIYEEKIVGLPQIVVNYRRDQLSRFGINIKEANTLVRTAFAGEIAGQVYEDEKRFDMVIRLDEKVRQSLDDVRQLFLTTPQHGVIPLSQIADISMQNGPNQIQRDNTKRRMIVAFNVRDRDVESVVLEIQQKMNAQLFLPPGYHLTYGGQFENLVQAKQRLSVAVPIALLLIFVLLYFTFHSIKHSLLIFTAIPLASIGGVFMLWGRDMPFSISAGVGFIALFGVAVLNGIVLIGEFNRQRAEGVSDVMEIIKRGCDVRLRPVLMTAMVASLGFLPMALSHGAGAEVQKPLASVVVGGLISATLLTLFILPILYSFVEKNNKAE